MNTKRYAIPALVLGVALLGGGTAAYAAFTPGTLPTEALSSFTADQQAAIKKAHTIRSAAEVEATAVLKAAGVSKDALHTAMKSFRDAGREKVDAALDANDYAAFKTAVAGSPMADTVTQDIFNTLVQIRALEKSGDHAGAMVLHKELGETGFGFGPGGHGPHGPPPMDTDN